MEENTQHSWEHADRGDADTSLSQGGIPPSPRDRWTTAQSPHFPALRLPLATKMGHGHLLPASQCWDLGQRVTMVEIKNMTRQEWLLQISRVLPSILSPQLHRKTPLELKAEWMKPVHPKHPEERFGFIVCFSMTVGFVRLLIWF